MNFERFTIGRLFFIPGYVKLGESPGRAGGLLWIISDVVPLGALSRLTTLHLNRNEITDINPLGAIDPLTELEVAGNQIADIAVLARLK